MDNIDGRSGAPLEVIRRNGDPTGKNPPLLFVHGAWHGAWCWDRGFLQRLSRQGFDVFAMSLRGHGNSAGHERLRTTRVRDFVDDIETVVDSLPSDPVIIGHSMGGFLTQKLMERRRLPGAVLLASMPPTGVAPFAGKLIRTDPVGALHANLTLHLKPVVSTPERVKRLFFSEFVPDEDVLSHAAQLGNEAFFAYLDMLIGDLCRPASGTPALVLGAAKDAIFPVDTQKRIAAAYETDAIFFPMAHNMMLEPGWERVADTIALWVRQGCQRPVPLAA